MKTMIVAAMWAITAGTLASPDKPPQVFQAETKEYLSLSSIGRLTRRTQFILIGEVENASNAVLRIVRAKPLDDSGPEKEYTIQTELYAFPSDLSPGQQVAVFCSVEATVGDPTFAHLLQKEWAYVRPLPTPLSIPSTLISPGGRAVIILSENDRDVWLESFRAFRNSLRCEKPDYMAYATMLQSLESSRIEQIKEDARQALSTLLYALPIPDLERLFESGVLNEEWLDRAKTTRMSRIRRAEIESAPPPPKTDATIRSDLELLKTAHWQAKSGILYRFLYPKDPEWILSRKEIWVDDIAALVELKDSQSVRGTAAEILIKVKDVRALHYLLDEMENEQPDHREEAWAEARKFLPPEVSFDPLASFEVREEAMKHIRTVAKGLLTRPAPPPSPAPSP